ncbi:aryl hydrocarbon receptor-like isoform X2 [Pristis pectinata]|uniref:aryl hydrocarbon receptor-like isoform X2 n=1 Tax=Pristis pectinata TaxID=685728 RepID=UPI00223E0A74|nr:aryl hydrocarbon receptor-like isoform X2 [Pristis pectinata]
MSNQIVGPKRAPQVTPSHPGLCTMIATTRNIFMGRKRKRVGQGSKSTEQGTGNATKSNPSKRHRDRLNVEFDNLLSLLPTTEDVAGRLDKLSVLRLSVSCLRLKRFFEVTLGQRKESLPTEQTGISGMDKLFPNLGNSILSEGDLILQALNGFVLVVTAEGDIFYASPTVQEYLGFHQTAVLHQPVFELIHPEDRDEFRRQLHWALNPLLPSNVDQSGPGGGTRREVVARYDPQQLPPENSTFLERNFVCKMRSLLNSSSGYVALNIEGRLKYLHGQNKRAEDGSLLPPQMALFAIATPLQVPSIVEIRTRSALFQTKHKLDFSPVACDAKARIVLGYSELELCMRGSGYHFIHAHDMLYCADNHVRLMKTGESGLTIFRLLTKQNIWIWVQANARLVYKNGQPDYIIARQRLLTDEEGIDHFKKRTMPFQLPFSTGEAVLYDSSSPLLGLNNPFLSENGNSSVAKDGYLDPNSLLGAMMSQDKAVYIRHPAAEPKYSFSRIGGAVASGSAAKWRGMECPPNGEKNVKEEALSSKQEDDLLSILDDILQSDNGEGLTGLPNVLESLAPEDLELMHWVESTLSMDVVAECPLSDMLTNDQVLSYVHESLKKKESSHQPTGLQANLGTGDQLPECLGMSQTQANRPPQTASLHLQQSMSSSIPQQSPKASYLPQEAMQPCNRAQSMPQQDLLQQQNLHWAHSLQQQYAQTSGPMQQPCIQQHVLQKQQDARPGPQLQQHMQPPDRQLPTQYYNQQSYHYPQQSSNPSPSPVTGQNPAATINCSNSNGYMRAVQRYRVNSQQNTSLFNSPSSAPPCVAPSQQSRLDFSQPSTALASHGRETCSQTDWFPGANQPNGTAFPLFSSTAPHVAGKSTNLPAFHPTQTVPLSHMNKYSRLHPEEQNSWCTVDLYKV